LRQQVFVVFAVLFTGWVLPARAAPVWVRVSFPADPARSMYISWNGGPANPVVEYGTTTAYGNTAAAVSENAGGEIGVVHSVLLENLQPDTLYHFRAGAAGDFSPDYTFRTAPADECQPFTFAVAADNRQDFDWLPSGCWKQVYEKVASEGPAFVFNSGDLVLDGAESEQWKDFMDDSAPWLVSVPLMACLGNHDDGPGEGDGANYNRLFALPRNPVTGTEDFYSFDYGNIHFAVLSTETFKEDSPIRYQRQRDWLDDDLGRSGKMWKIVFLHRPFYSGGLHGGDEDGQREPLLPVIEKHHVDLVIAGHDHIYERIGPIKDGQEVSSFDEGTLHIVSGGGGAATVPPHKHHYLIISVTNNVMHVRAQIAGTSCLTLGTGGSGVIEEFDIVKTISHDPCAGPQDKDGDGFSPPGDCCDVGDKTALGCSVANASAIHPGAQEICGDGVDQNCDGRDEPCACEDADHDGYPASSCGGEDCDDADPAIRPDAVEICSDSKDNDCDGQTDETGCELCTDEDVDGHFAISEKCPSGDDCDDQDRLIYPGAAERCNQKDDNCDGQTDEGSICTKCEDADKDGHSGKTADCPSGDDCDDSNAAVHPGAAEICTDSVDNDCDGLADGKDEDCRRGASGCGCAGAGEFSGTLLFLLGIVVVLRKGLRRHGRRRSSG